MRKKWLIALAASTIYAPFAMGLGLGEVTIHSKLNQPLDAEIEITSATSDELSDLILSVPSNEVFQRYDIERLSVFGNLQFRIKEGSSGNRVIHISSYDVIQDPFLTFLVEAKWPQGKLLREYTVLVDPPLFVPSQSTSTSSSTQTQPYIAPAATYTRDSRSDQGNVRRSDSSSSYSSRSTGSYQGDNYRVKRGDTLWEIANEVKPDSSFSVNQTMMAIYRNNAGAFDGNINRLKSGQVLQIPDRAEISRIARETANQEVRSQTRVWRGRIDTSLSSSTSDTSSSTSAASRVDQMLEGASTTTEGKLELKVPDLESELGSSYEGSGDASAALSAEGEQRIRELQEKVDEFERLLSAKDNELAALQQQLGEQYDLNTDTSLGSDIETSIDAGIETGEEVIDAVAEGVDETIDTAVSVVDTTTTQEETVDTTTEAVVEEQPVVKTPVVSTPVEEPSGLMSKILKYLGGLLGLGLLGLLGYFGYKKFGKGPSRDTLFVDEDLDVTAESIAEKVKTKIASKYVDSSTTSEIEVGETSFEESGLDPSLALEAPVEEVSDEIDFNLGEEEELTVGSTQETDTSAMSESAEIEAPHLTESIESDEALPFDDTTLADVGAGTMQLDQNDPLAETDFHMAYGLYDQAAELMQSAIRENSSFAYKEKLLEVFFVSGNKDEFLRFANEIKDEAVAKHSGSWDNIVIMGKQLAPDEPMFSGDVSAAGLDEGLDFKLGETGNIEVDSSLFDGLSADAGEAGAASDEESLDFSLDAGESDQVLEEELLDFNVEDAGASQMEASDPDVLDLDMSLDLPDAPVDLEEVIEDFSLDLDATLNGTEETIKPDDAGDVELASKLQGLEENTLTSEFNMSDLDMDIGSETITTDATDLDLSEGQGDIEMDLDISELGLSNATDAAFEQEDVSEETLDFSFDLDKSDDIEIDAGVTETSESELESTQGIGANMLEGLNADGEEATKEMKLDDNFDLMLNEGVDDTANAALDLDLEAMFSDNEADPFPDDTLQNMLPEGVSENDSGTMQLSSIADSETPSAKEIEEIFNPDDTHASTAQITEEELVAMGLSDKGPDLMDITGMSFTNSASTDDDVSTKLDLARAYIEMDDPDNAKSILQEVMEEGNDAQRGEAQDILLTLS